MPRSSSSYITQLPSSPSGLLREDGIQVDRANPNIILQTPFRISALSRFQIYRSTLPFLPGRLFYCTQIPACLWFLTKLKGARTLLSASRKKEFIRSRKGETLFIDARKLGTLIDRVHRQLTDADLEKITSTYHAWRSEGRAAGPPAAAVSTYVEAKDTREVVDIAELNAELATTVTKINRLRADIDAIVAEIEGEEVGA
jgi:type I restriction-modification system DNA methylase subunit